jgi:hypothetical protein
MAHLHSFASLSHALNSMQSSMQQSISTASQMFTTSLTTLSHFSHSTVSVPAPLPSSLIQPYLFSLLSPPTIPSLNPIPFALLLVTTKGASQQASFSSVAQQAHQRNHIVLSIASKSTLPSLRNAS